MISLSSQPFLLSLYSSCSLNDPLISHLLYFSNKHHSLCALAYKWNYLLKLSSYQKQGFQVKIHCSPFQLKELSHFHYHHNLLSSSSPDDDVSFMPFRSNHIIYKFFANSPYLTELI